MVVKFAFAVPLMPRSAAADWEQVQRNLRRTIGSAVHAAEGQPAAIYVACHEEPDLGGLDGENVHIRVVPFARPKDPSVGMRDRAMKRRFIGAWLRDDVEGDVYVMFLDADDLVDGNIVSYVLSHPAGSYVVDEGYLVDADHGLLLRRRTEFYKTCGSSFICRFQRDELPESWADVDALFSRFGSGPGQGHTEYPRIAREIGRPPHTLPFAAAVYVVNHGENHWTTMSGRQRTVRRSGDIVRPALARHILRSSFRAEDLAGHITGPLGVMRAISANLVRTGRGQLSRRLRRHHRIGDNSSV